MAFGILGGASALLAGVLFAAAFLRGSRKQRTRTDDVLRAAGDPMQASAAAIAQAAEAVNGATDIVRDGSRQQIAGTIAAAALVGWALGRRIVGPKSNQPSRKWPNAASGWRRSQMILIIANMGIESITPGMPHIQNQIERDDDEDGI